VKSRIGSTEKAAKDIDFLADVPLEEGLKQIIDWRRSQQ